MCGIAGFIESSGRLGPEKAAQTVRRMTDALAHRGPDGADIRIEQNGEVALGHRRLSIIDLSDAGSQPMESADGRWLIIFNGEIYNFQEMRQAYEAAQGPFDWRGHSDTEVFLETVATFGIEKALAGANGMFAIILWDRRDQALFLARDRMGEKPLYYGWQGGSFLFGSELKALAAHPAFSRRMDKGALGLFLNYGYVPAPWTIYRDIRKLAPGHLLRIAADTPPGELPSSRPFWSLPLPDPRPLPEDQALARLETLLGDSVRLRMRSDVPMGAFLSGGIDSSTIAALMQAQSAQKIRTFSIGFREQDFDESGHAARVAAHLGTDHMRLEVTPQDALAVVPLLPRIYDEPFADSSQIPTYLLAALTRQHVTVALSGDGGDEVFAGYARHVAYNNLWPRVGAVPLALRRSAAALLRHAPRRLLLSLVRGDSAITREVTDARLRKMLDVLDSSGPQDFYHKLVGFWPALSQAMPHPPIFLNAHNLDRDFSDPALGMAYLDMGSYLPDDILVKVDRAAMANSLECRIPILDHRIVEFAAGLPRDLKLRHGQGKYLLRRLLDRYVPRELIDRPKQGFGIPLAAWLRGPLRPWAEDLLNDGDNAVARQLDRATIARAWNGHLSGRDDQAHRLWVVLTALDWARTWRPLAE